MEKLVKFSMVWASKGFYGKNAKLLLPGPSIRQFQDTLLLTQLDFDYGNHIQPINLILWLSILAHITKLLKPDKEPNISLVSFILTILLNREKN